MGSFVFGGSNASRIGTTFFHTEQTPPDGALVRDGAAYSRTAYAALFAKIGTTYGAGDGSTTFNVPDDRGLVDRGWDNGAGRDSGRVFGSYQADDNKSHNHYGGYASNSIRGPKYGTGGGSYTARFYGGIDYLGSLPLTSTTGSESRMKNRAYLPCIWYK